MPEMMTDLGLLSLYAADGDQAAFAELVRRHSPMVYAAAAGVLGSRSDAEDVCQATFLLLARRAGALCGQRRHAVAGWLFKTAQFVAREANRKAARRKRRETRAAQAEGSSETTPADVTSAPLMQAVASLPKRYRDVVTLRYLSGRSQQQTAAELDIAENTVSTRLKRALDRLRRKLGRPGALLSVTAVVTLLEGATSEAAAASPALAASITAVCSGQAASATVINLVEITMNTLFWIKVKVVAATCAVAIALGAGGTVLVQAMDDTPAPAKPVEENVVGPVKDERVETPAKTVAVTAPALTGVLHDIETGVENGRTVILDIRARKILKAPEGVRSARDADRWLKTTTGDVAFDNPKGGGLWAVRGTKLVALSAAEAPLINGKQLRMMIKDDGKEVARLTQVMDPRGIDAGYVGVMTPEGDVGVIKIIGRVADPEVGVEIAFRMVEAGMRRAFIPDADTYAMGPEIVRAVNDDGERVNIGIDFETGKLMTPPNGRAEQRDWVEKSGVDAIGETGLGAQGLVAIQMVVVRAAGEDWDTTTPAKISAALRGKPASQQFGLMNAKPPLPEGKTAKDIEQALRNREQWALDYTNSKDEFPATYIFRTHTGRRGILQITGMSKGKKPRHIKVRYRMVVNPNVVLDLASGTFVSPLNLGNPEYIARHFVRLGKGDLAFDRLLICLRGATIEVEADGKFAPSVPVDTKETLTVHKLPELPCRLRVTTAEKKRFDVRVLSTENSGIHVEYAPAR